MLGVASIQVPHPLVTRLPPEVKETVRNGVILKHDVVHMSIFLQFHQIKTDRNMTLPLRERSFTCPSMKQKQQVLI